MSSIRCGISSSTWTRIVRNSAWLARGWVIVKANFVFGRRPLSLSLTQLYLDEQEQPRKKEVDKASALPGPCVVPPADPRSNLNQVAMKKTRVWLPIQSESPFRVALSESCSFFPLNICRTIGATVKPPYSCLHLIAGPSPGREGAVAQEGF